MYICTHCRFVTMIKVMRVASLAATISATPSVKAHEWCIVNEAALLTSDAFNFLRFRTCQFSLREAIPREPF